MGLASTALFFLGLLVLSSIAFGQGCLQSSMRDAEGLASPRDTGMVIPEGGRGNKVQKKGKLLGLLKLKLKLVLLVVMLPFLLGLALLMSFKSITISTISLVATVALALKSLGGNKHQDEIGYTHNVILAKIPGHQEHWLRRVGEDFQAVGNLVEPHFRVIPATEMAFS